MYDTKQPYSQMQTMSSLMRAVDCTPITVDEGAGFHGVGLQVNDWFTILFEQNGLSGITFDVDGYIGSGVWRSTNCYLDGGYKFRQRSEEEFLEEVIREIEFTIENCK